MFEADDVIFAKPMVINLIQRYSRKHKWCQHLTKNTLGHGNSVVVSNTSTSEKEVKVYQDIARANANFVSLIVENRNGTMSVHDVPEEVLQRQRSRFSVKL